MRGRILGAVRRHAERACYCGQPSGHGGVVRMGPLQATKEAFMARILIAIGAMAAFAGMVASADPMSLVTEKVPAQPLIAQVNQLAEALDYLGTPLPEQTKAALASAAKAGDDAKTSAAVQGALDPLCLLAVDVNPESRVKVAAGPAEPKLV